MTTTHDFGVVVAGEQQLTHEFLCRNNGKDPIALRVLGRGCNCLDIACPAEVLPGESKPVGVTIETRDRVGPFRTAVHLGTSDPIVTQIDLEIKFAGIAKVTVADSGPGIDSGTAPQVFDRFYTGDSNNGGVGLGLAIAKELAERMHGEIRLNARPGRTAFTLELPAGAHEE